MSAVKIAAKKSAPKYRMKISRLTVDKLGVKLYDRVSAVIAELVSNSYDADATKVVITAPMGEYLAARVGDEIKDRGYEIVVADNGGGMTPERDQRLLPSRGRSAERTSAATLPRNSDER